MDDYGTILAIVLGILAIPYFIVDTLRRVDKFDKENSK